MIFILGKIFTQRLWKFLQSGRWQTMIYKQTSCYMLNYCFFRLRSEPDTCFFLWNWAGFWWENIGSSPLSYRIVENVYISALVLKRKKPISTFLFLELSVHTRLRCEIICLVPPNFRLCLYWFFGVFLFVPPCWMFLIFIHLSFIILLWSLCIKKNLICMEKSILILRIVWLTVTMNLPVVFSVCVKHPLVSAWKICFLF